MQTRSVFDSIPLAMQDCQTHWRLLGLMGVLYAMMNGVMTLPGIVLDMAGVFESMFEGQLPTTFQSMTNEQQTATVVQTVVFFMSTFVNAVLWVGAVQLGLGLVDGEEVDIWDALCTIEHLPLAVGFGLMGLLSVPAFLCCLFPGVILAAACWHWPAAGIDRSCGAVEALGVSFSLFRANVLPMLGFAALMIPFSAIGGLCYFVVGIFTFPITVMATAHAYRIAVPAPTLNPIEE